MAVSEVYKYIQQLQLTNDINYRNSKDGDFEASFETSSGTFRGTGKSKKSAKEDLCTKLLPHLKSLPNNSDRIEIRLHEFESLVNDSFFKSILQFICTYFHWNLTYISKGDVYENSYHITCDIKRKSSKDTNPPDVKDMKVICINKTDGKNQISRDICLKYFRNCNQKFILRLMKNQLYEYINKYYEESLINCTIHELMEGQKTFKCTYKFSNLIAEGIDTNKKDAEGRAALNMLKLLKKNNILKVQNQVVENIKVTNNIIEDIFCKEYENNNEIDNKLVEQIFIFGDDVYINNLRREQCENFNIIFTCDYIFSDKDNSSRYKRKSFGIGKTIEMAMKECYDNINTAINMKMG
uniref:DRBM domain-containing protein n=1 Tax=Parastrongyloides trichosuri TaxID=131310 RepID=A0A0N4ZVI1_PARTI